MQFATEDPNLARVYYAASKDGDYCKIVKVLEKGIKRGEMRKVCNKTHPAHQLLYLLDTLRIVLDKKIVHLSLLRIGFLYLPVRVKKHWRFCICHIWYLQ